MAECVRAGCLEAKSLRVKVRESMLTAVRCLREEGLRLGMLTNNWFVHRANASTLLHPLVPLELFDAVVESARVGHRKPDPAIYRVILDVRAVAPAHLLSNTRISLLVIIRTDSILAVLVLCAGRDMTRRS